jgi:hypothetical protein
LKTIGIVPVASLAASAGLAVIVDDHGHLASHQVGSQGRQTIVAAIGRRRLDGHIAPLDEAGFGQALFENREQVRRGRADAEIPDHRHHRLLRARS